jgi:hypothetical protein
MMMRRFLDKFLSRLRLKTGPVAKVSLTSGGTIEVPMPRGKVIKGGRLWLFALHKSGSTLLNWLVADACGRTGHEFVNLPWLLFKGGLGWPQIAGIDPTFFNRANSIYGGFRHLLNPSLGITFNPEDRVVLLVRDPRDMLTSAYFSQVKSHAIPEGGEVREKLLEARRHAAGTAIDDYVKERAPQVTVHLDSYRELFEIVDGKARAAGPQVLLCRYEDVIYRKAEWLGEIAAFFGMDLSAEECDRLAKRHEIIPTAEVAGSHIRRVHPGDHQSKLLPETVAWLNDYFSESVKPFGYTLE